MKFPEAELEALTPPALLQHWKDIAGTQSVAWPWVMLCELALASFLTPNARFQPLASFNVYSLTWSFFLHPGSCHTSNLLRLYHNALHGLEEKANAFRATVRQRLAAQALPHAQGQRQLRQQQKKFQPIAFRLGTGSLEGIGLKIASFLGWTAAGGFLVEGTQFLQWLQTEFGVNKAIATQLWERMSWQRDVINLQRSFSMPYPFIGVCGALHLEDIWPLFTGSDPLGLRGRLCLFYTRPVMKRAREIAAANTRIGNAKGSNHLEKLLVDRYFPIYQAHAQEHRDEGHFTFHLDYPFLNYDFAADANNVAEVAFFRHFDQHAQLQEETYLVNHEQSKKHGKLKGKHLRHALNWQNLVNAWQPAEVAAWPTGITQMSLTAADLIGQHCEGVAAVVQSFAAAQTASTSSVPGGPAEVVPRSIGGRISTMLATSTSDLLDAVTSNRKILLQFIALLLQMRTTWLDSTRLRSHSFIRDQFADGSADETLLLVLRALCVVHRLGLGVCAASTNTTGPKRLFLVKRLRTEPYLQLYQEVLHFFHIPEDAFFAPSLDSIREERPAAAPLIQFADFVVEDGLACLEKLTAWNERPDPPP